MTASRRALALVAGAALVLVGGCGGDETTLERADRALGELERGELTVAVTAGAGTPEGTTAGPIGFRVSGRFDVAVDRELPVLDVTYGRTVGEQTQIVAVQSDGSRMVVRTDGTTAEVPADQARRLHLAEGDRPAGLGELGVSGWITEPTEADGPEVDGVATRKVSGPVDAANLISDLSVVAAQVSGQAAPPPLDDDAAARVQSAVRSGGVEVLVDDDDVPRRVRATVDFGSTVSPDIQRALGPYAAAHLEVVLEIRSPGEPVPPPSLP